MKQLWTEKHKPQSLKEITGQDQAIKEMQDFVKAWEPGKALLISGHTGVGKTLAVETLAKENNLFLFQLNASDARSALKIEELLKDSSRMKPLFSKGKLILLDEIDGISGHERGASNAIIKIIQNSRFPIIMIANDPWSPKLRPLKSHAKEVKFKKVHMYDIMRRLKHICETEKITAEGNVLRSLAKWSSGDMRSAILDLQMIALNNKSLSEKDLEILGYRERESNIFTILPKVFHSKNIKISKKAMWEADKDPDELFYWIETNLVQEMQKPEAISEGFNLLSKADLFRRRVSIQQNWRFKAYMVDLLASISLLRPDVKQRGFVPYKPPDRLMLMGRTKAKRAMMNSLCLKIAKHTHCSSKIIKRDYLPFFRIMLKKDKKSLAFFEKFELEKEEVDFIKGK